MCKENRVCGERALTFETMLTDPLIRLVMDSDGVSMTEMVEVLSIARDAVARREMQAVREMGWV